jgi:rubrerythrin
MNMRRFQRRKEDFVCEHCRQDVSGDGFTNHCPHCLWSKHVDVFPGDRNAICDGLMAPIRAVMENGAWKIVHRCEACGYTKRNKKAKNDSLDALLALMKKGVVEI